MMSELEKIQNKIIIVEGPKDKLALENLGYKKVFTLTGKALFEVVESLPNTNEVIILTDLDKKGKELYHKLKVMLTKRKIKVDDSFRLYLFKETKIRQIEGLKFSDLT